jgi:hypothetical protein
MLVLNEKLFLQKYYKMFVLSEKERIFALAFEKYNSNGV